MEVLTLNGQKYVKASKAARDLGYASDYVGQLCRKGSVDAHLVGRTWYVNPETLGAHRVEKKRNARAKAREYARKTLEETTRSLHVEDTAKSYKNIDIRYETDDKELIPVVKKLNVESHFIKVTPREEDSSERYTIENENQKIVMSGSIPVQDAELEEQYTDTTVLTPRILKRPRRIVKTEAETNGTEEIIVSEQKPRTFAEKIAAKEVTIEDVSVENTDQINLTQEPTALLSTSKERSGSWVMTLTVLAFLLMGVFSMFITHRTTYSADGLDKAFEIDHATVYKFIAEIKDISARLVK